MEQIHDVLESLELEEISLTNQIKALDSIISDEEAILKCINRIREQNLSQAIEYLEDLKSLLSQIVSINLREKYSVTAQQVELKIKAFTEKLDKLQNL